MLQFVTDTQSDWQQGTLQDCVATSAGDLELDKIGDRLLANNLFANPRLLNNGENWTPYYATDYVDSSEEWPFVHTEETYGGIYQEKTGLTAGEYYVVSYYVKHKSGLQDIGSHTGPLDNVEVRIDRGTWQTGNIITVPADGQWHLIEVRGTATASPTDNRIFVQPGRGTAGVSEFYFQYAMFEQGQEATEPDLQGTRTSPALDLSPAGTANDSTISWNATAGDLSYDDFSGDVSAWLDTGLGQVAPQKVADAGATGGYVFRASGGEAWYYKNVLIPFDPNKLYIVRGRVRQVSDPTSGGKAIYIGVEGVASDGVTMLNVNGVNSHSSQHYVAASGVSVAAGSGWHEFVGYIKGTGTPAGGQHNSIADPAKMYPGTAYIRPLFILNYDNGNGTADIDLEIIEFPGEVVVETSLDGGQTWQACTNGGAIPGITAGMSLEGKSLLVRQTLSTTDTTVTPQLHDLAVSVYQLFTRSQVNHVGRIAADYSRLRILGRSILGYTGQLAADVVRQQILLNRHMVRTTTFGLSLRPYKPSMEWVPLGTFWSLDWDSPDDTLEAQVRARDRLELLRKSTYQPGQVQQNVSLYTLAEQVLLDAGLKPGEYIIDTALQSIIIPWAWLSPTSHREALRIIAEAALAVVYADRDGIVRIESMADGLGSAPVLEITSDDYFPPLQAPSRQDQVANEIVVTTQPLRPAAATQEVYRSTTPISVPAGQTVTVAVKFSQQPVIEAAASLDSPPAGVSIITATYYAWGAEVTISNTGASTVNVTLVINGKPLSVQGGEQVIARDEASIMENGVLRYEFPANPLVQTLNQAQDIANAILASAKDPRRDIEVEWRGNPALELGDRVTIVGQDVHVIRQEITWAGALSARLTGRKVT